MKFVTRHVHCDCSGSDPVGMVQESALDARHWVWIAVGLASLVGWGGCRFDPLASVGTTEDSGLAQDASRWDGGRIWDSDLVTEGGLDGGVDSGNIDSGLDSGVSDAGCVQGATRCNADRLEICDGSGNWVLERDCPVGCDSNRNACRRVVASNGLDNVLWNGSEQDVTVTGLVIVDTTTGQVSGPGTLSGQYGGAVLDQPSDCGSGLGKQIGVMLVRSLTVQPGATLRFVGDRSVAIVSMGPVAISGVIDVSGGQDACPEDQSATRVTCAGPGGFGGGIGGGGPSSGSGPGAGGSGENGGYSGDEAGGGGGGHAADGGRGGNATAPWSATGGAGGGGYGDGDAVPLCGGSGGGGGGPGSGSSQEDETSHAGGGGGAIQVVSQVAVTIDCSAGPCGIRATGAGGMGDHESSYDDGGGGGGAGGTVLIEAPVVNLADHGVVSVAGGAGGCGYDSEGPSRDGRNGPFGDGRASVSGGCDAPGGRGGGGDVLAGETGDNAGDGGGGGGGAAGWIRINCYHAPGCFSHRGILNPHFDTAAVSLDELSVQ